MLSVLPEVAFVGYVTRQILINNYILTEFFVKLSLKPLVCLLSFCPKPIGLLQCLVEAS